jgi:hypothetical protein
MNKISLSIVLSSFIYFSSCQDFHSETSAEGITIFEKGDSVLFYQAETKSLHGQYPRANYIHPLYNLDGVVITEDFPADHYHQRGIFWAWHQLWIGSTRIANLWLTEDILWDVYETQTSKAKGSMILNTKTHWKSSNFKDEAGSMQPIVREEAEITVYSATKNYRIIDFDLQFYALVDSVMIGGSEDAKGYGGFSVRVEMEEDLVFTGESGVVEPQALDIEAGSWIDISGKYPEGRRGITIIDHPDNPGYPQTWILRRSKSMQNPKYPGKNPVLIPREQPLRLKYRLLIHRGDLDKKIISGIRLQNIH